MVPRILHSFTTIFVILSSFLSYSTKAWTPFTDTTLNVSQIAVSMPENKGIYLGSPSITRSPVSSTFIASHDTFGSGTSSPHTVFIFTSNDEGSTWQSTGSTVSPMYWATLFTRPNDNNVYIIGTSGDGSQKEPTQIVLSSSTDEGKTWANPVYLSNSTVSYSTGPTPVIVHNNRLWRVFEHNTGPGWATGYSSVVISVPVNVSNLMDPTVWTLSGELPFSTVASLVPTSWSNPAIKSGFGWLEGNAIIPVAANDTGINIMLRVNSIPAANKAALLYLSDPTAVPVFVSWIDFPGGNTKFTIRKDETTGAYLTLSNNAVDDSITFPPVCGPMNAPTGAVPCCGFLETCFTSFPNCLWCHANNRNNLTLSISTNLLNWTIVANILEDDTGVPAYISAMGTGFQYVDWNFDTVNNNDNVYYAVRAGYRGSNNYHNSNRNLFGWINDWKQYIRS